MSVRCSVILWSVLALLVIAAPPASTQTPTAVLLEARPDSSLVTVSSDGQTLTYRTPARLELAAGTYQIEFTAEGYEPLPTELTVREGQPRGLRAALLPSPPIRPIPADLGLSYMPIQPQRLETEANGLRENYYSAAEVFAVMPLAQAAFTLSISGETQNLEYFVGAGLVLTVTSVILGRRGYESRLEEVREANQRIKEENRISASHNQTVDEQIEAAFSEDLEAWQLRTVDLGRVESYSLDASATHEQP